MGSQEYINNLNHIRSRFDEIARIADEQWQDSQGQQFKYQHISKVDEALRSLEVPISHVIDRLESKLDEIKSYDE